MKSFKKWAALLLLVGAQGTRAEVSNPPTEFLDSPTYAQSDVVVLHSNAYGQTSSVKAIEGQGIVREVRTLEGRDLIYIEKGLNGWSTIQLKQPVDLSGCEYVNLDVYVVTGAFDCKVNFQSGTTSVIATPKLQEGWNRVALKLDDFRNSLTPPSLTEVSRIALINNGGYARTIYVDNIFGYGRVGDSPIDDELPEQMAPAPAHESSKVRSIFSDAYAAATEITNLTGTGQLKVLSVSPTERIIKIEGGLNHWANLNFKAVSLEDRDYLHVDVFVVRDEGTVPMKFKFDTGLSVQREMNPGWNQVDIPLSEFKEEGTSLVAVTQFCLINSKGTVQNVFVDNLYAYGQAETGSNTDDPSAPTEQLPAPKHSAENVVSLYSNHYTNVAKLTLSNPGNPTCEMDEVTPFAGDEMLRFTGMNWALVSVGPAVDLSQMAYIHFDIYALSDPKIVFGLGDGGANEGRSPWQYLQAGWNQIDIPLSVFAENGADLTNVSILRMFSATGFAIGRLYFDNIFAFNGDPSGDVITYEIPQAPEPILPQKDVKAVLADKYLNLVSLTPQDEAQGVSFPKIEKDDWVIKMFGLTEVALQTDVPMNLGTMDSIHVNVYAKTADARLRVGFMAEGETAPRYADIDLPCSVGEWTYANLPVSALTDAGLPADRLVGVAFRGAGDVYVDNLYAFRGDYFLGLGEEEAYVMDWDEASKADQLPSRDETLIGVNLASACGGAVHGNIGVNYFYPTMQDLYYFKSKGVRLIRFPFRWERVQHELNGALDMEQDVAEMQKVIAEAERLGMYVMPDMHNYCRRQVDGTTYKFGESDKLTKEHFADVWKKLAAVFKDYSNIWGYDVMNEPYGLSPGVWTEAAQAVVDAIREVDTETPIVLEGESYAAASSWPTTGGNKLIGIVDPSNKLIYQAHCYFDADKSGLYKQGSYDLEVRSATQHIDRLKPYVEWLKKNGKKGILGEFGVPRNDSRWLVMLDEVCRYLKENGVNGTYWVGGNGYANDHVSVQPLNDFTTERAQMRVLEKYFPVREADGIESMQVVPNGILRMEEGRLAVSTDGSVGQVRLYSADGRLVGVVPMVDGQAFVEMASMPKGVYVVQVAGPDGQYSIGKIIK